MADAARPTVSLGLGSGGARGYAHIGVLRWLDEQGIDVRSVAGSSMGALVGGVYAAGKLEEFTAWARAIRKTDILGLLDVVVGRSGVVAGRRVMDALRELVGEQSIEDLPLPFTAVASDLDRDQEVWITSGSLFDAIRASISIPLFFVPHELEGRRLLDGGILNPVPVAPTLHRAGELSVAVNLCGPPAGEPLAPVDPGRDGHSGLRGLLDRFLDGLGERARNGEGEERGLMGVAAQLMDTMQATVARMKLAAYPPDVLLTVPRDVAGVLEFDRAEELIELGHALAEQHLGPRLAEREQG